VARSCLAQTGAYGRELAKVADEKAVEIAADRAAALVGKRYVDGELVDNPDSRWSITNTTREIIRQNIADGFRDNLTVDEIAANIVSSAGLSAERARTIAQHEVFEINNSVALNSFRLARDEAGVKLKKVWETSGDDNVCEDCLENEAAGEIDLDDDFPSGSDSPPEHVNCGCQITAVADDSDDRDTDESEDE
jgi:Phage Mu protein F like protein